jgi:hypothetical protein
MKSRLVTIDFDDFRNRIDDAKQCIINLLPCQARISAGGDGLHIKKTCYNEIEHSHALSLRTKYDDPKRLLIDRLRAEKGLTGEILLRKKCIGQDTKEAGEWVHFNRVKDAMNIEVLLCR